MNTVLANSLGIPRLLSTLRHRLLTASGLLALIILWQLALLIWPSKLLPQPHQVVAALWTLLLRGTLIKHAVASLFRVTWGYGLALLVGIPLGLLLGWYKLANNALNPVMQMLRPISPLAWIPIAILWFGVGDTPAIFIIFLGSFCPMAVAASKAVDQVDSVHINAARNFGLGVAETILRVVLPASLPQLIVGMRLSLGVAWLVVVAGEMMAVNSGLGFLIIDARNAGNRYDLVVGGMLTIGVIGVMLDHAMRSIETRISDLQAGS